MRKPVPAAPQCCAEFKAAIERAGRRVTSYDVALLAGVSQSAVSRCFKPGASVSKATYARVMKAAEGLDYIPNAAARSLITRRSNLVALIVCGAAELDHPLALAELSRQLAKRGKRVLLFTLERESELDTTLSEVWRHQVDGVIAAAALSEPQLAEFTRRRVPLVLFNRSANGPGVSSVLCDQGEAARLLVSKLAAAGHRQFALIDGPPDSGMAPARLRGTLERAAELGLPAPVVVNGSADYAGGGRGLREIVALLGRVPDAILCGNDMLALGCLDTARHEMGISIPGKMAVAGCDAIEASSWLSYRLTTLRQPIAKMAQAAADLLAGLIETQDATPERRVFCAQLVEGATARLDSEDSRDLALRLALNKHGLMAV